MIQCFRCGECCREHFIDLMLTHQELILIKERTGVSLRTKLVRKNRYLIQGIFDLTYGDTYGPQLGGRTPIPLVYKEDACPFLNEKNECIIYDIRPCQCRLYHCGRLKSTDKRLESINQIRELMAKNPEYDAYKRKEEAEAMEWGNAHGWEWRKIEK